MLHIFIQQAENQADKCGAFFCFISHRLMRSKHHVYDGLLWCLDIANIVFGDCKYDS